MDQNQELENLRQEFSRAIATLTMNQSAIFQMLQFLTAQAISYMRRARQLRRHLYLRKKLLFLE